MSSSSSVKTFVLDTNVILHDSRSIFQFEENDVVLPIQVIEELDSFKKGDGDINFHAREFCRFIDEISKDEIFNGGVSIGEGLGNLRVQLASELHPRIKENLREHNVDAEIINLAYKLQEQDTNTKVVIISKDTNLRLKAKALGVLAQDFLHESVKNLDVLSEEVKILKAEDYEPKIIDSLSKKRSVDLEIKDARESQNFFVQDVKGTILAKYQNGKLHFIHQRMRLSWVGLAAKNHEQSFAMDALLDENISLITIEGGAGTGKTLLALACGLEQLKNGIYEKMFFTRQTIAVGSEPGAFPGDIEAKVKPYMHAMYDNLDIIYKSNHLTKKLVDNSKEEGNLAIEPLSLIRGRSLPRVFFIIDEAQNLTPHEIKTIVTRAGEGAKIVFMGDTGQIDHAYLDKRSNGLSFLIDRFRGQSCHTHIRLIKSERSKLAEIAGQIL